MSNVLPGQLLGFKFVEFSNKMATDEGSDSDNNLSTWRPNLAEGWYYLGQTPSLNYHAPPSGLLVCPLAPNVLVDVQDWELVWDDAGSNNHNDYALWRGIPPNNDYIVIGGIFSNTKNHAKPKDDETRGIKAIRKDLLVMGGVKWVWNDGGSGSDRNGSVWTCGWVDNPRADLVYPQVVIPMETYNTPAADKVWALNRSKVIDLS